MSGTRRNNWVKDEAKREQKREKAAAKAARATTYAEYASHFKRAGLEPPYGPSTWRPPAGS